MRTYESHPNPKSKQRYVISSTDDGYTLSIIVGEVRVWYQNHDTLDEAQMTAAKMVSLRNIEWIESDEAIENEKDAAIGAFHFEKIDFTKEPIGPVEVTVDLPKGLRMTKSETGRLWNYAGRNRTGFMIHNVDHPKQRLFAVKHISSIAGLVGEVDGVSVGPLNLPNGSGIASWHQARADNEDSQCIAFLEIDSVGVMLYVQGKGELDRDKWLAVFASIRLRAFDEIKLAALGENWLNAFREGREDELKPVEDVELIDFTGPREFSFVMYVEQRLIFLADSASMSDVRQNGFDYLGAERRVYADSDGLTMATLSEFDVPVTFEFRPDAPSNELSAWDHVVDASLAITTSVLDLATMRPFTRWQVPNGSYRVRICYGNLANAGNEYDLDAEPPPAPERDHYRVIIWPGAVIETTVLKQWTGF